jgi:hypothetical protein
MKVYRGKRTEAGTEVTVADGGTEYALNLRFDLRNHSPTGLEWGYAGSGPAQLALALTADALGDDDRAQNAYQRFKFAVVGSLAGDTWTLTEEQIRAAVADIERTQARVAGSPPDGRSR